MHKFAGGCSSALFVVGFICVWLQAFYVLGRTAILVRFLAILVFLSIVFERVLLRFPFFGAFRLLFLLLAVFMIFIIILLVVF